MIKLTKSQAELKLVNANVSYVLWPRASGKTNAIGDRIDHLSEVMPRSQILLFSDTFKRLEERIVPNLMGYWINDLGLIENEDFKVFAKPPDHWDKPLLPLKMMDHVISFSSGMAICLASQQVSGSANAYNAQAMLVDEAKYTDETVINTEALPALRGSYNFFGELPEYRSHWYFTDKYGENIKWLLAKKKLSDPNKIKAVLTLSMHVIALEQQIANASSTATKYKYIEQRDYYNTILTRVRKEMVFYSDALPYENLDNLGEKYFRDLARDLTKYEYNIAIENKDPDKAEHSFYPTLNSLHHYYNSSSDVNKSEPLIISLDYNWRITPMVVAQFGKLDDQPYTTLNFVAAIHTLHPEGGIELTVKKFTEHFSSHGNKHVYFVNDHTAVGKRPDGKSFAAIVMNTLSEAGWTYTDVYMGLAPFHDIKFESIKKLLSNTADMAVKINRISSNPLIRSIQAAGTKSAMGKTQKDKSKEKQAGQDPVEQTDYSDAFDQILWAVLVLNLISPAPLWYPSITMR